MSNPLLKPNDSRFQRPVLQDGEGKSRFTDPADDQLADAASATPTDGNIFAARTHAAGEKPYQPQYETTHRHRGTLLLTLAILGLSGAAGGATALAGLQLMGWVFPLLALCPAAMAWLLSLSDLSEMATGAMDPAGRSMTRLALWLGVAGIFACLGVTAAMIWLGLSLLPNVL